MLKLKNVNFTKHIKLISTYDVNINRMVVSNKIHFGKKGFKSFIGYKDGKKIRLLCVMLSKMSAYKRNFDETKYLSFW